MTIDHSPLFIHYSMLVTAILGLLAPLAAYTSYYFIFAILVAQVSLQISSSQFLVDIKSRVCARGSPIHPLIRIYQDGFPVRNEAGSVAHSYDDCNLFNANFCSHEIHTNHTRLGHEFVSNKLIQVYIICFPRWDGWNCPDIAFVWHSPQQLSVGGEPQHFYYNISAYG